MIDQWIIGLVSLLTSVVAGVLGMGGGLLLIAILPAFLLPSQIIPIHAVTQLASNASRTVFALKHVSWHLVPGFLLGSVVGCMVFALLINVIRVEYIPICIGTYILLSLWSKTFDRLIKRFETFFTAGFFQTGLGVIVGATGPLTNTLLLKSSDNKETIIATGALFMSASHTFKILLFGFIGFNYLAHIGLLIATCVGAIVGSWLGTRLRRKVPDERFMVVLKVVLTVLSLRMIVNTLPINLG